MRILYLEDSDYDIDFIRRYVSTIPDSEFVSAKTLEAAQYSLSETRPDVFLVDVMIDGEASYPIIEMASSQNLADHIVLLTARALPSELQHYRRLGCQHVVTKPFTADDLDNVFSQVMQ